MVEWNTQYTQNPAQYPPLGGNQTQFSSASTPAHFGSNAGQVGVNNGVVEYPYTGDQSSGHFQLNYPSDNIPATRLNDIARFGHPPGGYQQVPGSHGQPRGEWQGNNQGAQYPPVTNSGFGAPVTAIPPGMGVHGGGYFSPGAESMTVLPSGSPNPTAMFGDDAPNYREIQMTADGKRYRCECGHETKTTGDMTRHHETSKHSGQRYACPCGKRYFRKDGLTRHEKTCPKRN